MRIGHFTPAYGGKVEAPLVGTVLADCLWAHAAGHEFRWWYADVQPVDRSRNMALARARELGCDWLLMLDADVFCDPRGSLLEALAGSLAGGATAVGAVVVHRGAERVCVEPVRPSEVYRADKVGTGALLVDVVALDRLASPSHAWFRTQLDTSGVHVECGEDVFFCREVTRLGGEVVANFQIPTRHVSSAVLGLEGFLARYRDPGV